MPKLNLNVVIVCGNSSVDLPSFTKLLTEPYEPNVSMHEQNACTLTKAVVKASQTAIFNDFTNKSMKNSAININSNEPSNSNCDLEINFWDMNPKEHLWSRLKAL